MAKKGITTTTVIAIIVLLIAAIAGTYYYTLTIIGPPAPPVKPYYKLALSICSLGHPYFAGMVEGAQDAVSDINTHFGEKVVEVVVFDAAYSAEKQVGQVETILAQDYDFILLNPTVEEALVPAVVSASAAGIPVLTTDRDVAPAAHPQRLCFIATDNVAAGALESDELVEALTAAGRPKPWKIVVFFGIPGSTSGEDRKRGHLLVLDELEAKGEVEYVAQEVADFDRAKAMEKMTSILAITMDIDAVIASNDEMALGAISAIAGAGLKPNVDILIAGFDAIPEAQAAIRVGTLTLTIGQSSYTQGYWAVLAAYLHLEKGWEPAVEFIPTPVCTVNPGNIETFAPLVFSPRMDLWSSYGPTVEEL